MHQHKLHTKRFVSGTLLNIPNYTSIPYLDAHRERVEVQCHFSIIGMGTILLDSHYLQTVLQKHQIQPLTIFPKCIVEKSSRNPYLSMGLLSKIHQHWMNVEFLK